MGIGSGRRAKCTLGYTKRLMIDANGRAELIMFPRTVSHKHLYLCAESRSHFLQSLHLTCDEGNRPRMLKGSRNLQVD